MEDISEWKNPGTSFNKGGIWAEPYVVGRVLIELQE